jgi:hypothetical protein
VQNGKLAAAAAAVRVTALKRVDLPTFGRPTMPILKPMGKLRKLLASTWFVSARMSMRGGAMLLL